MAYVSTREWTAKAKRNSAFVHRTALQSLYDGVVSDTPVLTGNARRSWLFSTSAMPMIKHGEEFQGREVSIDIASAKPGVTAYIGGQAAYLPRLNWGFTGTDALGRNYNQAGKFFVEANAAKWSQFVAAAARKVGG